MPLNVVTYVTLRRVAPLHLMSYYATRRHLVSRHVLSVITPRHLVIACSLTSGHVKSRHVTLRHVTSFHITSHHVASCHMRVNSTFFPTDGRRWEEEESHLLCPIKTYLQLC